MENPGNEKTSNIAVLPPGLVRKIAAGEVIDRPAALVREFIDNAIDAGGKNLELVIEDGGIKRTELIDDGSGMTKADLELCWLTHATSKIRTLEDLVNAETLGFRGEALSSAAAVARLEALSSRDGREAWRLEVDSGRPALYAAQRARGTSIRAIGLFDTIPVRKRFLKRGASESLLCRQMLIDKALAFPAISFRLMQDGSLKTFLPPASSYRERFGAAILRPEDAAFLHEIFYAGQGFSLSVVIGGPELCRRDRRQQYVIANGRRIQDFSLIQALEYGSQGYFPNGTHPVGAVYVNIDPSLADFNIHPAKREVRFKDPSAIHHGVTSALSDFMRHYYLARRPGKALEDDSSRKSQVSHNGLFGIAAAKNTGRRAMEALLDERPGFAKPPRTGGDEPDGVFSPDTGGYGVTHDAAVYLREAPEAPYGEDAVRNCGVGTLRYVGRLFRFFILVEAGEKLYIIDQHAAHERLIFDSLLSKPVPHQELLLPIPLETDGGGDEKFLEERRDELKRLGVFISRDEHGDWYIEALPSGWKAGDRETAAEILDLKNAGENLARRWAATLSCHGAVKDGDYLGVEAALDLAEAALTMDEARCPHGRPIWMEISRQDVFRAVRRQEKQSTTPP